MTTFKTTISHTYGTIKPPWRAAINKPYWQSSEIIIFFCKYYIVVSDTLAGSFLGVLCLLLAGILSEFHEKPRRKDCITKKKCIEELAWGISLFWLHVLLSVSFCYFLCLLSPPSLVTYLWNSPYKVYSIAMDDILCDDIISERHL